MSLSLFLDLRFFEKLTKVHLNLMSDRRSASYTYCGISASLPCQQLVFNLLQVFRLALRGSPQFRDAGQVFAER